MNAPHDRSSLVPDDLDRLVHLTEKVAALTRRLDRLEGELHRVRVEAVSVEDYRRVADAVAELQHRTRPDA